MFGEAFGIFLFAVVAMFGIFGNPDERPPDHTEDIQITVEGRDGIIYLEPGENISIGPDGSFEIKDEYGFTLDP